MERHETTARSSQNSICQKDAVTQQMLNACLIPISIPIPIPIPISIPLTDLPM